ncbi:hypothetical protein PHLGIDRAFT_485997 [Phlebiopsis gigantea 11061_1 CR5-6]|uniref:Uncharacterized protein n=1 Tax=Phlebiopsis gigantea (strain 11061_1 CR5-6) TaxID=745531 RepID=A0A0C3S900_PHLG1|nr:hypothetical protein PHLGIDRAFT_485997 [Phlebiopsis gigantea 11061_1 CR5-6]
MVTSSRTYTTTLWRADWESQNYYWRVFGILRAPLTNGAQELRFPIKRLPAELMAQVMYWYIRHVQEQARSDRDDEVPPTPYSWLTIRHVCRFWRNIAFQHPQLSTTICLTRYACIKEMVTLSGRLPIHVYERPTGGYHRTRHEALAILALVMDNLHRVATAEIDDWHWYDVNYANPPTTLPSETSPIQSLTWKSCLRRNVSFLARNASGPTILPRFSFPNLQHLSCYWVGVQSIRHMLHRSLLRLELHEPPPMSENSLLAILEEMPALEFLTPLPSEVEHRLRERCRPRGPRAEALCLPTCRLSNHGRPCMEAQWQHGPGSTRVGAHTVTCCRCL